MAKVSKILKIGEGAVDAANRFLRPLVTMPKENLDDINNKLLKNALQAMYIEPVWKNQQFDVVPMLKHIVKTNSLEGGPFTPTGNKASFNNINKKLSSKQRQTFAQVLATIPKVERLPMVSDSYYFDAGNSEIARKAMDIASRLDLTDFSKPGSRAVYNASVNYSDTPRQGWVSNKEILDNANIGDMSTWGLNERLRRGTGTDISSSARAKFSEQNPQELDWMFPKYSTEKYTYPQLRQLNQVFDILGRDEKYLPELYSVVKENHANPYYVAQLVKDITEMM